MGTSPGAEVIIPELKPDAQGLATLRSQLVDVEQRLVKLYDALETGEFQRQELAPRIRALLQKKDELQQAKAEAEESLRRQSLQLAGPDAVRQYARELRDFIEGAGIVERKAFLKSFVDRIEVDRAEATVVYTLPIMPDTPNGGREAVGVLPFVSDRPPVRS